MNYNYFRSYDPAIGRYTQSDPIGLLGGLNTYNYAYQSPLFYTDPSGQAGIGHNGGPPLADVVVGTTARLLSGTAIGLVTFFQSPPLNAGELEFVRQQHAQYNSQVTASAEGGMCTAEAGKVIDKGGELTRAGRALQKHGSRPGSVFPAPSGNPANLNQSGQQILEDIINSPSRGVQSNRYGGTDIYDLATGRGVRYDASGSMIGFLEP